MSALIINNYVIDTPIIDILEQVKKESPYKILKTMKILYGKLQWLYLL